MVKTIDEAVMSDLKKSIEELKAHYAVEVPRIELERARKLVRDPEAFAPVNEHNDRYHFMLGASTTRKIYMRPVLLT